MNRIMIMGPSGSGKTTICRNLGIKLNSNYLHLDSVYWEKDWQHKDKETFNEWMEDFLKKYDRWVIDGNYANNNHFRYRLDLCDTIVYLDYGTQASLRGIHQREKEYKHQVRSDMAEGCYEGIDQVFLKYVANFDKKKNKMLKAIIKHYESKYNKNVLIFKNREELYEWYSSL